MRVPIEIVFGAALLAASIVPASAQTQVTIYKVTGAGANDFVPFAEDGTPNRPHGNTLGNTVTFSGTARYLTHVQVVFGWHGPKERCTYTLALYRNDGPRDTITGLSQPGTKLASFQTVALNQPLPGNGAYGVDWTFPPTRVPDTLTVCVSSTYGHQLPGQVMGPFTVVTPPVTGSVVDTIWYGDGTPGHWVADAQWAIKDGAKKNSFDMTFEAVAAPPKPSH